MPKLQARRVGQQLDFDAIVCGLGGVGSAAAYHLACRGVRVLGLEAKGAAQARDGNGKGCIVREAYVEGTDYKCLLSRAYALWQGLQTRAGEQLLLACGAMVVGQRESLLVRAATASASQHGKSSGESKCTQLHERFSALRLPEGLVGAWESRAGVVFPQRCVAAHLRQAALHSAQLNYGERVQAWAVQGDQVLVRTARRSYRAGKLILTPGAALGELAPSLASVFSIERQVHGWFRLAGMSEIPVSVWHLADGSAFYTLPDTGGGLKLAAFNPDAGSCLDGLDYRVYARDRACLQAVAAQHLAEPNLELTDAMVSMATNTADGHVVIDFHPHFSQVVVVGGGSRRGFKYASALGEAAAELVVSGATTQDLSRFRLSRFERGSDDETVCVS